MKAFFSFAFMTLCVQMCQIVFKEKGVRRGAEGVV